MAAIVLDGKALARQIEESLILRVAALKERSKGVVPMLATILVGGDPSSATYVRMKENAAGGSVWILSPLPYRIQPPPMTCSRRFDR